MTGRRRTPKMPRMAPELLPGSDRDVSHRKTRARPHRRAALRSVRASRGSAATRRLGLVSRRPSVGRTGRGLPPWLVAHPRAGVGISSVAGPRSLGRRRSSRRRGQPFPILLFSPSGNPPHFYTELFEELASHGYVVAGIAHTYETIPISALPKGGVRLSNPKSLGGAFSIPGKRQFVADLHERAGLIPSRRPTSASSSAS